MFESISANNTNSVEGSLLEKSDKESEHEMNKIEEEEPQVEPETYRREPTTAPECDTPSAGQYYSWPLQADFDKFDSLGYVHHDDDDLLFVKGLFEGTVPLNVVP